MTTRLSLNINDGCREVLLDAARDQRTTVTEQIRRAISVYDFAMKAKRAGLKVQTVDNAGRVTEVTFL